MSSYFFETIRRRVKFFYFSMIKLHSIWEHYPLGAPSFHIQSAPARVSERRSGCAGGGCITGGWRAMDRARREQERSLLKDLRQGNITKMKTVQKQIRIFGRLKDRRLED